MRQQGPAPALLPVQVLRVDHTGGCTSSGFTHWVCRCIPCPWWGDKSRGCVTHLHREVLPLCGAPSPSTSPTLHRSSSCYFFFFFFFITPHHHHFTAFISIRADES